MGNRRSEINPVPFLTEEGTTKTEEQFFLLLFN